MCLGKLAKIGVFRKVLESPDFKSIVEKGQASKTTYHLVDLP